MTHLIRTRTARMRRRFGEIRRCASVVASLVPLAGGATLQAEAAFQDRGPSRYYVSPQGSDHNSGGPAAPFRTIQHAADQVEPGDTVIVRPGMYSGPDRVVSVARSGTPRAWITFRAEGRHTAIIDGKGSANVAWYFGPGVGFVRVEGFEIRNLREHGFDTYGGGVHDIIIARNRVHHIGRYCTDTSNGRTGAAVGGSARRVVFDGNLWYDIGRLAPGERGCSPRTEYYQNHDHGIYVADADEVTIRNNIFLNFERGWAVHRYYSKGGVSRGLLILNNTFVGSNPYRPGQIIIATPTEDLRIENNIFHAPQTAGIYFDASSFPRGLVQYNLVSRAGISVGRAAGVTIVHNRETADPGFRSAQDFHLRPESPAVDAGVPLIEVAEDADGVPRPRGRGYDLGAYER